MTFDQWHERVGYPDQLVLIEQWGPHTQVHDVPAKEAYGAAIARLAEMEVHDAQTAGTDDENHEGIARIYIASPDNFAITPDPANPDAWWARHYLLDAAAVQRSSPSGKNPPRS